ncbi:MAG: Imidazolonepropionase [Synergistetes bacterium ADurb.Bin155]|jgi:imidazolonepropionase|nr:imidazolonepropionase [Synergistales bacterium]MBP8995163.1 imidazolonepropionase [Synergistales bacterium]NMD17977.1 imidazolonepropionase [Synergistaceae bacterium]OQB47375.1 MAG: Imidazolonepropionase [Synergistetes bacterium ADurb.Bin155]HQL02616.1 imidazolonepropionase [Synergistales bacterium]
MTMKLFRGARIYTPLATGNRVMSWEKGAILARNGFIEKVGPEEEVLRDLEPAMVEQEVNFGGRCVVPGFVDPHTHMCFSELREQEFALRLSGVSYMEILASGGGILSSVRSLRAASDEKILERTKKNALTALSHGTTTVEIKSGYGLDTASETRMLRLIERAGREIPTTVIPTFMGAHAIPSEFSGDPEGYVDLLVREMIPAVSAECDPPFCDVFCEEGVFTVPQSRRILEAARKHGMKLKIHADEVVDTGGAALAAELGAVSAEHLLAARGENLAKMASEGVIAVLLPATAFSLRKPYADARKMLELGLTVALATDCNPGSSFTQSMPFVFSLAVMNMGMTVEEALAGCTLNAAKAIESDHFCGSLEKNKMADFVVLDGETPAIMAYNSGVSPVLSVYKRGECAAQRLDDWRFCR